MPDDDPHFESTADHYARHRPGYPSAVVDHLAVRFGLDGDARVLDLGCGTGELAVPLAARAGEVVGMDPAGAMLDAARERAADAGVGNVRFVEGDHTDLDGSLGPIRLTVMGRSFHWTDGAGTLDRLRDLAEPGGGVAIGTDGEWLTKGVEGWQDEVYAGAADYLDDLPERTGPVEYDDSWADLLAERGFVDVETTALTERRALDADAVVGYVLSLSFCSPERLGDDLSDFEHDLRARLADVGGPFAYERRIEVLSGVV